MAKANLKFPKIGDSTNANDCDFITYGADIEIEKFRKTLYDKAIDAKLHYQLGLNIKNSYVKLNEKSKLKGAYGFALDKEKLSQCWREAINNYYSYGGSILRWKMESQVIGHSAAKSTTFVKERFETFFEIFKSRNLTEEAMFKFILTIIEYRAADVFPVKMHVSLSFNSFESMMTYFVEFCRLNEDSYFTKHFDIREDDNESKKTKSPTKLINLTESDSEMDEVDSLSTSLIEELDNWIKSNPYKDHKAVASITDQLFDGRNIGNEVHIIKTTLFKSSGMLDEDLNQISRICNPRDKTDKALPFFNRPVGYLDKKLKVIKNIIGFIKLIDIIYEHQYESSQINQTTTTTISQSSSPIVKPITKVDAKPELKNPIAIQKTIEKPKVNKGNLKIKAGEFQKIRDLIRGVSLIQDHGQQKFVEMADEANIYKELFKKYNKQDVIMTLQLLHVDNLPEKLAVIKRSYEELKNKSALEKELLSHIKDETQRKTFINSSNGIANSSISTPDGKNIIHMFEQALNILNVIASNEKFKLIEQESKTIHDVAEILQRGNLQHLLLESKSNTSSSSSKTEKKI